MQHHFPLKKYPALLLTVLMFFRNFRYSLFLDQLLDSCNSTKRIAPECESFNGGLTRILSQTEQVASLFSHFEQEQDNGVKPLASALNISMDTVTKISQKIENMILNSLKKNRPHTKRVTNQYQFVVSSIRD
ncbi:uncharacterized protein LOC143196189 [Rhynchophorus ferrugineus]|uniref:uncharacterized protein LOC143196189 n=1 Tax=Rhynchophorus ferrugineus TaxID=354439 RepID=UPI003FCD39DE